ncbi:hypothetical protein N0M98_15330 [Paenibacillus doosanensis]|nr:MULTISPECIES: hypothetical protein [Paenibacillus]MCS7461523.1 hypothetical protein [Paenibacillus doosanensis]
MPTEFALDLCFIREHGQLPLPTLIDRELQKLFAGRGSWYIDFKVKEGLDIAVAEVKGLGTWETEDELLQYIEESMEQDSDSAEDSWEYLQGYQVKVWPKIDAGSCRIKTR